MNYFGELPDEITVMIFRNCDLQTLKTLRKVSHRFHRISNIDSLWKSEAEKIVHDNYNELFLNRGKKEPLIQFSPETFEDWNNAPAHGFSSKGYKETYMTYKKYLFEMSKCKSASFDIFECFCSRESYHKSYKMCCILLIPFLIVSIICMVFCLVTLHITGYNYQSSAKESGFFYQFTTAGSFFFLGFVIFFPVIFYLLDYTFLQLVTVMLFPISILCFSIFADGFGVRWLCVAGIPEILLLVLAPLAVEILLTGRRENPNEWKVRMGAYLCIFVKLVGFILNVLKKDAGWNILWSVAAIGNYLYFALAVIFFFCIGRKSEDDKAGSYAMCILHVAAEIVLVLSVLWMDGIVKPFALVLLPIDLCLAAFALIGPPVFITIIRGQIEDYWEDVEYSRIIENENREYRRIWKKRAKISKSFRLALHEHYI